MLRYRLNNLFVIFLAVTPLVVSAAGQPNILLLIADDYGVDQSPLYTDSAVPTPHIMELAERGVTFEHLWAAPKCTPTRATLLTGQYGFREGNGISWVLAGPDPRMGLNDRLDAPHYLPRLLGEKGYDTGLIGKWHVSSNGMHDPIRTGFDFWTGTMRSFGGGDGAPAESIAAYWSTFMDVFRCEDKSCEQLQFETPPVAWPVPEKFDSNYKTTWEVDRALEWIAEKENPWFLWMAFQSPHTPLQLPPEKLVDNHLVATLKDKLGKYQTGYWEKLHSTEPDIQKLVFRAMVSALDTEIGRLLDNINLTNTYVIFIGDNGTIPELTEPHLVPPGHAKGSHFEGGIRVPFVFSGPNLENPGSRTPVLTQTSDIYATVLALAGAEINTKGHPVMATEHVNIDGRSLLPVVQNGEKTVYGRQYVMRNSTIYPWMNPAFPPKSGSVEWKEGETIRDERYKLHRMTLMNQKNGFTCLKDPQPSKNNPVPCDITERAKAYTLYDLNSDPLEKNDLLVDGEGGLNDRQTAAYHRLKQALVELMN